MIYKFAITNLFGYRFERNCKQKIMARCDAINCPFYICVKDGKNTQVTSIKEFRVQHKHGVGIYVRWILRVDGVLR